MAPHSSTLAWKLPWTEEPGRLQSMGSRRVRHDWATSLSLVTFMHWRRKWQPTPVFLPGESQGRLSSSSLAPWSGSWMLRFLSVSQSNAFSAVSIAQHYEGVRKQRTQALTWRKPLSRFQLLSHILLPQPQINITHVTVKYSSERATSSHPWGWKFWIKICNLYSFIAWFSVTGAVYSGCVLRSLRIVWRCLKFHSTYIYLHESIYTICIMYT